MTLGPDGNVWFIDVGTDRIVRVTPDGTMTPSSRSTRTPVWPALRLVPTATSISPRTTGTGRAHHPTTFVITESARHGRRERSDGITAGPDGNLWFTEGTDDQIGRITTDLMVTDQFSVSGNNLHDITAGPDGNLWFTETHSPGAIGRITRPASTPIPDARGSDPPESPRVRTATSGSPPARIRARSAGSRRPAPITLFTTGLTTNGAPLDIAAGADGNLYFTENASPGGSGRSRRRA